MTKSGLPQSARKYIRLQKAKIRREVFDMAEQERRISKLYENLSSREEAPSVIPSKPPEPVSAKQQ